MQSIFLMKLSLMLDCVPKNGRRVIIDSSYGPSALLIDCIITSMFTKLARAKPCYKGLMYQINFISQLNKNSK